MWTWGTCALMKWLLSRDIENCLTHNEEEPYLRQTADNVTVCVSDAIKDLMKLCFRTFTKKSFKVTNKQIAYQSIDLDVKS
jgi:hypothetical protein